MNEIAAIYRDGAHFDRMWGKGYFEFWLDQARISGGPILELGCGTGKLSIPLAEAGFSVTGLDSSSALLEFAASKNSDVRWVEGDMRDFDLGENFALIMLPSNNLGHLHTPQDFANCIQCAKRHLKPGGVLVIDVFVPNLERLLSSGRGEYTLDEYDDPDGRGSVRITARSRYEASTQIVRTTTFRKIAGQPDVIGSLDLKMYFPRELEALVLRAGLCIADRFGGHAREEFGDESRFQILVCDDPNAAATADSRG